MTLPECPDCFRDARDEIQQQWHDLARQVVSGSSVSAFLQDAVDACAAVYAATAAALWLLDAEGNQLRLAAEWQFARLGLDGEYLQPHHRLLHHSLQQPAPYVVGPSAAPTPHARTCDGAGIANPTDSFLVLGALRHGGQPLGVLELGLGPRPPRGQTAAARQGYARFLGHLISLIEAGLRYRAEAEQAGAEQAAAERAEAKRAEAKRVVAEQADAEQAATRVVVPGGPHTQGSVQQLLARLQHDLDAWRTRLREHLQQHLTVLAGTRGESLKDNQLLAKQVQRLLDANSLRVQCPECGHAAILRCQASAGTRAGVFVYDHYLPQGRTFHGGQSAFPALTLVDKPPRKARGQSLDSD